MGRRLLQLLIPLALLAPTGQAAGAAPPATLAGTTGVLFQNDRGEDFGWAVHDVAWARKGGAPEGPGNVIVIGNHDAKGHQTSTLPKGSYRLHVLAKKPVTVRLPVVGLRRSVHLAASSVEKSVLVRHDFPVVGGGIGNSGTVNVPVDLTPASVVLHAFGFTARKGDPLLTVTPFAYSMCVTANAVQDQTCLGPGQDGTMPYGHPWNLSYLGQCCWWFRHANTLDGINRSGPHHLTGKFDGVQGTGTTGPAELVAFWTAAVDVPRFDGRRATRLP